MSIENELRDIKDKIENIKTKKIELGSSLKVLEKEKAQLLDECSKLGVDPKKLADEIVILERQIQKDISDLKKQLDDINV